MKQLNFRILLFICVSFFFPDVVFCQQEGIRFEHVGSWNELLEKARRENKHIMVDCYTTWCGPCRMMEKNIFPLADVGDFYNKNFLCLKLQFDSTKNDPEYVRNWRDVANRFTKEFGIAAYPTFLYFSPAGKLIHRVAGANNVQGFIDQGRDALNPDKQYYTLLEEWKERPSKKPSDIKKMFELSETAHDSENKKRFIKEYVQSLSGVFKWEDVELLVLRSSNDSDLEFQLLLQQEENIDRSLGKGTTASALIPVILQYEPIYLKTELNLDSIRFEVVDSVLKRKYPRYAKRAISFYKLKTFEEKLEWENYILHVLEYTSDFLDVTLPRDLHDFARNVERRSRDPKIWRNALIWCEMSLEKKKSVSCMDTYARLLIKLGERDKADKILTDAARIATNSELRIIDQTRKLL